MNCSFCARAGTASAATPTTDASAIPTCFLFIGSSIETPEVARRGSADPAPGHNRRGLNMDPRVGVSSATSHGVAPICRGKHGGCGGPRTCRGPKCLQTEPWPPQALTFKLKMRKPREHLGWVIGIAIGQREDSSPSRCARDGFWDHKTPPHGKKGINDGVFCRSSRCTRCVCGPSSV